MQRETHKQLFDLQTIVSNITIMRDIQDDKELKELALELDRTAQKLITKALRKLNYENI
jgi:hypothetical protein